MTKQPVHYKVEFTARARQQLKTMDRFDACLIATWIKDNLNGCTYASLHHERKVGGMNDLTIAPGPGIPCGVVIAAADLTERFARSSGPGGQGVNTTDSKVQLSLDVEACASLSDAQRQHLLTNLEHRLDGTVLTVSASTRRSQIRNRAEARRRMAALLREALAPPPPPRRKTKPTRASVRRRLEAKKRRSELKSTRRRPQIP